MPVQIFLRYRKEFSPFRHYLRSVITAPGGNSILLCSGYAEPEVIDDDLADAIGEGCTNGRVILVGRKCDSPLFNDFAARLRKCHGDVHFCKQKWATENNWHAKIALRYRREPGRVSPIAAVIGSSNLTVPACGIRVQGSKEKWNYECDTLIYIPLEELDAHFRVIAADATGVNHGLGVMFLRLDDTEQPNEQEQLEFLYQRISLCVKALPDPCLF